MFYHQDQVELILSQEHRYKKNFHPYYYEEIFVSNEEKLNQALQNPNCIVKYHLKSLDQVFPTGLTTECVLTAIQNNRYRPLESYVHMYSTAYPQAQTYKILSNIQKNFIASLPGALNSPNVGSYPVLSQSIPKESKNPQFYRLNSYFIRQYLWSQHQNQQQIILYNTKSDFFTEDDLGINQIAKLHKRWEKKAIQTKKQLLTNQLQGQQDLTQQNSSSNPEKRVPKDYPQLTRTLHQDLWQANNVCHDSKVFNQNLKALIAVNKIDNEKIVPNFSSYINQFTSAAKQLPSDSSVPFEDDVIDFAKRPPLQILLVGKPRSGRTTFSRALAKRLDIEHIDLERPIMKLFDKVKENEENPQNDDEGNPKEFLTPIERSVVDSLRNGNQVAPDQILELLNLEFSYDPPSNRGYILDLPIEQTKPVNWLKAIKLNKLKLPHIQCMYFTHIIMLEQSDESVKKFVSGLMEKQEDLSTTSQAQRDELRRPKPKVQVDEDDEPIQEDDEENKPQPVNEADLYYRPCDDTDILTITLKKFEKQYTKYMEFFQLMLEQQAIKIGCAGLITDELVQITTTRIAQKPLRPLAIKLEGSSEKELLTLNLEESKISRQWSQWQQIDPVELSLKARVINGKVEFACDYAGRVFLFENEENQNRFLANPRKYLNTPPVLPKSYNIAIGGPMMAGKRTIARLLAQKYGWQLVDVEEIIKNKITQQKIQETEKHLVSSFDSRVNDIHLTEQEWKEFAKGGSVSLKDVLPMVLNHLNINLQRKPQGWGEPKKEEEEEEKKDEDEEDKRKRDLQSKKQIQKKKKEEEKKEEQNEEIVRPATPPPEDVPTKEIIPLLDEEKKIPDSSKPKGIILVGYPQNQEQIDLLNLFGIKLDRVIVLNDKSEDQPGAILLQRPGFSELYNPDQEVQFGTTLVTLLREAYGEENIKEVGIDGSPEEVFNRVLNVLDPFHIRCDDEALVRTPADVQEGDDPISFGDYAHYCPVTLKQSGWLVPGKEESISLVRGRVYRFFGEKEQTFFKDHISLFIKQRPSVPPPRIMLIGVRGGGLHTQLRILNELYKFPILSLRQNLLQNLEIHKKNRQLERYFMRGFKPQEIDEEGKEIVDPEIQEDTVDFDRKTHEIEVLNQILKDSQGIFIDGNFFDVGEDQLSTPFTELLSETRKLPEIVIFLKVELKTFLARNFDQTSVQNEFNQRMQELKTKRQQERNDARQKAIDEGLPEEEWPSLNPAEGQADEDDPEAPKLEDMLNEKKEKLIQQYESDIQKVDELFQLFQEELKIPSQIIIGDASVQQVTDRISTALHPVLDYQERKNLLERHQCYKLNPYPDPENFTINRLMIYENSYNFRQSRFGDRNPITLQNVPLCRDYPLLYRNRIYYLETAEERDRVSHFPLQYLGQKQPSIPNDIHIKPCIFIVGLPKSGKSTISKALSKKLGLVRIKIAHLISTFIQYQDDPLALQAKQCLLNGQCVDQETLIQLLVRRTQMDDCYSNGWILDGYPQTRQQAVSMSKHGIIPTAVFAMSTEIELIKDRVFNDKYKQKFGGIDQVLQIRLNKAIKELPLLTNYYMVMFNNVRFLQTTISNWGLISLCTDYIHALLHTRGLLSRSLITHEPVNIHRLTLTTQQIAAKLSPLLNYCPVQLKSTRTFYPQSLRSPHLMLYEDNIYICNSEINENDFKNNPNFYTNNSLQHYNVPIPLPAAKFDKNTVIEYQGYCPVALSNALLKKGQSTLIIEHKGKFYSFATIQNQLQFEHNPKQFKRVHLPDKIPQAQQQNKNIAKKVAKRGDCTSYLEQNLRNIIIRVLAQLGYKRIKYPTISCKETVLKFIAISLKANNPNKDASYRAKYQKKLDEFLRNCDYPQQIQNLATKKHKEEQEQNWQEWDQENLLNLTEQFQKFIKDLQSQEKQKYFQKFIS